MTGAILLALLVSASAAAQDDWSAPPPVWEGTWAGTIGALPIHVCLDTTPTRHHGAYYYDRHRALIRLELSDDRTAWVEKGRDDRAGARLRIAAQGKDSLAGSWSDGRTTLPLRLRRIDGPSTDYLGPCGSDEFHRPRVRPVVIARRPMVKDGAALTRWTFRPGPPFDNVDVTTFTLNRPGAAVARVNAALRAILPRPDGSGDWLDCMAGNANAHGADGDFSDSIEPTLVSARWLAATHNSGTYCGGAHPNTSIEFRTFDLDRGVEVDPLDWFSARAVTVERYAQDVSKTLTPAFRGLLLAGHKPDGECKDVLASEQYWTVGVERGALVFSPHLARVVMACGEDFRMTFALLEPWLNAKGKAAVASLPR